MIKSLYEKSWMPLLVSSIVFVYFQLQIFNLGIQFRDEGFLLLNATRILSGDLPYKDFFMTTTPGSFYLAAIYTNIFGPSLLVGRLLYFVFVILLLVIVNFIFNVKLIHKYVILLSIALLYLGIGSYAYYNIESLVAALASFYFLLRGLRNKNKWYVFLCGVLLGISFIFKQSFAFWPGISFLTIIFADKSAKPKMLEYVSFYIIGAISVIIPFFAYFYLNEALSQALYYIGTFSREVKAHRTPFILKSLISIPLIYIGLKFLQKKLIRKMIGKKVIVLSIIAGILVGLFADKIAIFAELSRFYYALFIFLPVAVIALVKKTKETKLTIYTAIFLLGLFVSNASSGRELGVVMWVAPLYIPLTILISENIASRYKKNELIFAFCYFLIFAQAFYLSSNNLNPSGHGNGLYTKQELKYKLDTPIASGIKVSATTKRELDDLILRLGKEKASNKLLCFPYCPLMNVITKRQSPSYYNFFYPEAFLPANQNEVINNLKKQETLVVIQKKGRIEPEAGLEDGRFGRLKNYVLNNYQKKFETTNFSIFSKD